MQTPEDLNRLGLNLLPSYLGIVIIRADADLLQAQIRVRPEVMAPNGFLHAGTLVTLADTTAGYGCLQNMPEGAAGFTTIELKSNHVATVRDGMVTCEAKPMHLGRTTQVWDVTAVAQQTGRVLALFRCTQLILYPKQ